MGLDEQRVDGRRCPGPSLAASVLSHSLSRSLLLSLFMKDKDTAIVRDTIPVAGTIRVPAFSRALPLVAPALVQMWRESGCAHECLLGVGVRADASGSLRGSAGSQSGEISPPGSPGA
jgi:hypothetical protein